MDRDTVIALAREATKEAPREDWNSTAWVFGDETLERFAALVAAHERKEIADILLEYAGRVDLSDSDESLLKHLFDLIRARGNT